MKTKQILAFLFTFSFLVLSCTKQEDIIEIYLTKNKIESYDGVPLRVGIKDSISIKNLVDIYGEGVRVDTITDKPIYMGHFNVQKKDLEEKPFIIDSEILGFDFEKSEMHFSESVTKKIYNALPSWNKENIIGKQFALCHNGEIVLTGYLYPAMGRYRSNTYQISFHRYPEVQRKSKIKSVVYWVHDSAYVEKNYLLKDKVFYNTFKKRMIKE